ncbi:hypothetical protein ACCS93_35680 [Rhizobium ruizarguesonis]
MVREFYELCSQAGATEVETQQIIDAIDKCSRGRNDNPTLQRHWCGFVGVYDLYQQHATAWSGLTWRALKSLTRAVELALRELGAEEI